MVPHFLEPLAYRFECAAAGDIIHQQDSNGLSIVSIRDCSVALLPSRVPDLRPDQHVLHLDVVRRELHPNRRQRLPLELVLRISEKQLGLAHFGVPDQDQLEHVVV